MKFPTKYLPVKRRKGGKQQKNKENRTAFPLSLWTPEERKGKGNIFPSTLFHWKRSPNATQCYLLSIKYMES